MSRLRRHTLLTLLAGLLGACNLPAELLPALTAIPAATTTISSHWETIAEGLSWRILQPDRDDISQLVVVRIDPRHFRFRAIYHAGAPKSLAGWRKLEPQASVIVNANFFDHANRVLGAVVSDGALSGSAYLSRGGTFLVRNGVPSVVGFRAGPPPIDATTGQAIQGFPLLVYNGLPAYSGSDAGERNRRTVIAEDADGNILIVIAPYFGPSLRALSDYLPSTDLDIVTAVNLDGGGSTMIALPGADYLQPSFDAVPTVLAVYPR